MLMIKIGIQHGLPVRQPDPSPHRGSNPVRQYGDENDLVLRLPFLAWDLRICLSLSGVFLAEINLEH